MDRILINISRIVIMLIFAIYTYYSFKALKPNIDKDEQRYLYRAQIFLMYLFLAVSYGVLYLSTLSTQIVIVMIVEFVFFAITISLYRIFYPSSSQSLITNMCMLMATGLVILSRLDPSKAIKQLIIALFSIIATCLIPMFISKVHAIKKYAYVYAGIGIVGLLLVLITAKTEYGAKLSISFGVFSIQPSEIIKILFVFFLASMLSSHAGKFTRKDKLITIVISGIHVLILVASRDLGGAAIYLVTFVVMYYVATKKKWILIGGGVSGVLACVVAYFAFSHVRTRFVAWLDPLSDAENAGYQVTQSLFAIGSGGWIGTGLYQGMPGKVPVVTKDFIFAGISEELGGVVALCIIFICISCFLMFFNISLKLREPFYKMLALGLGTVYVVELFLNIGGTIKFIPSTGVTLPLISYGGSSLFSTIVLFAVIQGLYVLHINGGDMDE